VRTIITANPEKAIVILKGTDKIIEIQQKLVMSSSRATYSQMLVANSSRGNYGRSGMRGRGAQVIGSVSGT
jgi:hypothetical protein